jgi:hypothetical protein
VGVCLFFFSLPHIPTPWAVGGNVLELFSFVFTFTTHLLSLSSLPYFNKLIMDGFMKNYD